MTAPNDLPPVGATVVDGWGMTWVLEWHSRGADEPSELAWTRRVALGPEFAEMEKGADISRIWQLEQARQADAEELAAIDAVMARRPALDQPTRREKIEHAIGVAKRCDSAEREVAELRQRLARFEALAREAREASRGTCQLPGKRRAWSEEYATRLAALAQEVKL